MLNGASRRAYGRQKETHTFSDTQYRTQSLSAVECRRRELQFPRKQQQREELRVMNEQARCFPVQAIVNLQDRRLHLLGNLIHRAWAVVDMGRELKARSKKLTGIEVMKAVLRRYESMRTHILWVRALLQPQHDKETHWHRTNERHRPLLT